MTAESIVPSPSASGLESGYAGSAVRPVPGFRFPARRPHTPALSPVPLLTADLAAALAGAAALDVSVRRPFLVVALLGAALLLRPRPARTAAGALDELPSVWGRIAVGWLALAALAAAQDPAHPLSPTALLSGWAVHAAVAPAGRALVHRRRRVLRLRQPSTALVIGPAATAQRVAAALLRQPECGVRPVGVVTDHPDGSAGLPVLTLGEQVERALIQNGVGTVLTVDPAVRTEKGPLLRALAESGCTVWEMDADCPAYEMREQLAGFSVRRLDLGTRRRGSVGKRLLDLGVSGALLVLAAPLLLCCALVLRLSQGPGVVFRQERIGQDGRPFTLLKFRTYRPVDERESATRWSVADERRMNPFCRFMRRTSLDELLQLWNVFRGDMSLVGPRPERPYFVTQFSQCYPGYAARHRMRVGITGLAQVSGLRGDTSIEDRARYDNAYIDNWSLWQDVCILLRTAAAVVRSTGS